MQTKLLIISVVLILVMSGYYIFSTQKPIPKTQRSVPSVAPTQIIEIKTSPTPSPYPDTKSAIAAFLANKYKKPVSEVKVIVDKEAPGYAAGSVLFGQGGPGEGGMWLAVLGNGWEVVWDGNGSVDCNKMRQGYGFPDAILKPNFCD